MFDCVVRGGLVVDGTGVAERRADIAISDGVIVEVGKALGPAHRVVDAGGLTICPGFIDVHTHYDAQLSWDPFATPSSNHGVTTVVAGNCGFSLAPLSEKSAEYIFKMMARVEAIPLEAITSGVELNWQSFGEWLHRFKNRTAVNVGFYVGHSTLRYAVMGNASREREATDDELSALVQLLDEALSAGALGFSTSWNSPHLDADGAPVPSRNADAREMIALAGVVSRHPGTSLQISPANPFGGFTPDDMDLLTAMSCAGNRPINWNVLKVTASEAHFVEHQLSAYDYAAERGGSIIALANGNLASMRVNFKNPVVLDSITGWREVLSLPMNERLTALRSPDVRETMRIGAASMTYQDTNIVTIAASLLPIMVEISRSPENAQYLGRTIGEIAEADGRRPIDVVLDIAVADDLDTIFRLPPIGNDPESWKLRAEVWADPRVIVGGSDAGAHLDMLCGGIATTAFLSEARDRQLMEFPRAVFELTGAPAALHGLYTRGRIAPGFIADLVVLDPATVGSEALELAADLPGGAKRLTASARGIDCVLVGGEVIIDSDELTDLMPGRVLRPGVDTTTVPADHQFSKPKQ